MFSGGPMKRLLLSFLAFYASATAYAEETFTIEQGDEVIDTHTFEITPEEPRVFNLDFSNAIIPVDRILHTGIVVDEIPTLLHPKKVDIETAKTEENLKDDDYVLGVDVEGEIHIYPLSVMNWHQGINDIVAGLPVFVSWDPLTGQPLVIDRRMDGTVNSFGVSGLVYRSTTLYYDSRTQSLWSPIEKRAVTGRMSSYRFNEYPSFISTLSDVEKIFPEAQVLSRLHTGYNRDYDTNPYGSYGKDTSMLFPVRYYDSSLPRKEYVLGVTLRRGSQERHVAFPVSALLEWKSAKGIKFTFGSDVLPGIQPIQMTVHYMEPEGRFEISTPHEDVTVDHTYSYWFIWSAFHPNSHVVRYIDNS